ncbi:hypothetical protein KKC13_00005, partial [bacterium]|nr:hypothetical protein [bacterium]MBU1957523.1 hypothetical protein [bacterium]
ILASSFSTIMIIFAAASGLLLQNSIASCSVILAVFYHISFLGAEWLQKDNPFIFRTKESCEHYKLSFYRFLRQLIQKKR